MEDGGRTDPLDVENLSLKPSVQQKATRLREAYWIRFNRLSGRCSVWFLCETRSPGYRVRHPSREPCRFPHQPREARTKNPVATTPRRPPSRRAHDHQSAHDFDVTGAFEAPKEVSPRSQHRFGFRSPPRLELATSSSRPLSSRRSFRSARFSVPGPDKVAFSRLLSRVARPDQPFPRAPFRVPPS